MIIEAVLELFDRIVDENLLTRHVNITATHVIPESSLSKEKTFEQLDLFTDYEAVKAKQAEEDAGLEREKRMQQTVMSIKKRYGFDIAHKLFQLKSASTFAEFRRS